MTPTEPIKARIEVFRPGTFKPMGGEPISYSAADLRAIADAYDADGAPAPVVIGHPDVDAPAFGWVSRFDFDAGAERLYAELHEIEPQFAEMVKAGRFRKVSMAFFSPSTPHNPVPGTWYPKHVGFLGAAAPAVSGLKPARFAGAADATFEAAFGDRGLEETASILRTLRDFFIEKFGLEETEKALPSWRIEWLGQVEAEPTSAPPHFAETGMERVRDGGLSIGDRVRVKDGEEHDKMTMAATGVVVEVSTAALGIRFDGMDKIHKWYVAAELEPGDGAMTMKMDAYAAADMGGGDIPPLQPTPQPSKKEPAVTKTDPAVAAREAEITAREAEIAAREAALAHAGNAAFAESLVANGRLLPASRDKVVHLLDALPGEASVAFAEGAAKVSPAQALREVLEAQPKIVSYGALDIEGEAGGKARSATFAADGQAVDPAGLAIHHKALDYQRQHPGTAYLAAVHAVS
jgi:hypothetical protein